MSGQLDQKSEFKRRSENDLILIFLRSCKWGFPAIAAAILIGFVVPFFSHQLPEKILVAKLTHASMGMLFGIFELLLGVLLALIGVSSAYDIDASVGGTKLKLISASPGILLIISANLLIAFCLMRPFEASQQFIADGSLLPSKAAVDSSLKPKSDDPKPLGVNGPQ